MTKETKNMLRDYRMASAAHRGISGNGRAQQKYIIRFSIINQRTHDNK